MALSNPSTCSKTSEQIITSKLLSENGKFLTSATDILKLGKSLSAVITRFSDNSMPIFSFALIVVKKYPSPAPRLKFFCLEHSP